MHPERTVPTDTTNMWIQEEGRLHDPLEGLVANTLDSGVPAFLAL